MNLEKFEALANAATPGPWTTDKPGRDVEGWARGVRICTAMGSAVYADPPGGQSPWADVQFIAAARTACVDLIAEVRRLREENDRIRAASAPEDCDAYWTGALK